MKITSYTDGWLVQLHHEFKSGSTDVKGQRFIRRCHSQSDMRSFLKETDREHPLVHGASWLAVLEDSELFMGVAE